MTHVFTVRTADTDAVRKIEAASPGLGYLKSTDLLIAFKAFEHSGLPSWLDQHNRNIGAGVLVEINYRQTDWGPVYCQSTIRFNDDHLAEMFRMRWADMIVPPTWTIGFASAEDTAEFWKWLREECGEPELTETTKVTFNIKCGDADILFFHWSSKETLAECLSQPAHFQFATTNQRLQVLFKLRWSESARQEAA